MTNTYIPFHRYSIGPEEKAAVLAALDSGWITKGPKVAEFEQAICEYTQAQQALALNSCTAGLHLAMLALNIGPGDEVITTPLTFVATVNMIEAVGATPVLIDVDLKTFNLDAQQIEAAITPRTKAILPVHLAGQPCDLAPIIELAASQKIAVIDDAAHAIGASYKGKKIGAWCDATVFSFYATKNITTGEGGMLLSPHESLIEKARPLSLHGLSKDAWKRYSSEGFQHYLVQAPGYKYNMNDIQAAMGIEQLKKCDDLTAQRKAKVEYYHQHLQDLPLDFQQPLPEMEHAYHLFPVSLRLDELNISRDQVLSELHQAGIGCAVHFIPVHFHPYYQSRFTHSALPNANHLGQSFISLPLFPALTQSQQDRVIEVLSHILTTAQR